MKITKWGFGSAPLKENTKYLYKKSLHQVDLYINDKPNNLNIDLPQELSNVKGLFNRIIKQDQWDWFTVHMYFDYPELNELNKIVQYIYLLRKSLINRNEPDIQLYKDKLINTNFSTYVENFINYEKNKDLLHKGYIYILSQRENKDLLKIGMTNRNVIKRCDEINSATGVLFPFSPRGVFKVKDAVLSEKLIHEKLSAYRVRKDREFFILPYKKAYLEILECLNSNNMLYYEDSSKNI